MIAEEWRAIKAQPDYEISNLGRVRSLVKPGTPIILKTWLAGAGYEYVGFRDHSSRSIHCLVAEAFLGKRPTGHDVRHLDGDKLNNRVDNLAYGTRSENMLDTLAHGTNFERNKTHCKRGHEFTEENTEKRVSHRTGLPARACKTCIRDQKREWMRARRSAARVA